MLDMLKGADQRVSIWTEELARRLSRRQLLFKGITGFAATTAAVTLGTLTNVIPVSAACTCNWIGGLGNANCPNVGGCTPSVSVCPSGCNICTCSACGCNPCGNPATCFCPWTGGQWVSCSNLGTCGNGYELCTDCMCTTCSNYKCTCRSNCICCGCCSPKDVVAEMHKLRELGLPH